jgi:ABC-type bacteriocin/lantibiotic exporter with double-glycine peptidase domain
VSKIQRGKNDCAVVALQNALRVYGRRFGYHRLYKMVSPDKSGADENDLLMAISILQHPWVVLNTSNKTEAREWLRMAVPRTPVILCVDDWGHWVIVAGVCRRRVCLQDSENKPSNTAEGGTHWVTVDTVMRRWRASRKRLKEEEGKFYYGIALLPKQLTSA